MLIASSVRSLAPYVPGEQPDGGDVVKLNTNENPYPPSPRVAEVLASFDLDRLRRYPDPTCAALRRRIAEINGTTPERVFVGNGSDEVLALAARAFVDDDEAIGSFDPSYSLYKTLAAIRNVPFVPSPLAPDFTWAEPVVFDGAAGVPVSLFLLTNPNAPTSTQHPAEVVDGFARSFKGVAIVDEAYVDFAEGNCMGLATSDGNSNVVVMRTLSKSFSLAGLRLGYCVGPEELVGALSKVKDSYNVDAVAQAVALAALCDVEWMESNARKVRATRAAVTAALRERGWTMPDSQSNFLFARPPRKRAAEVFEALRARRIFVRYFPGARTGDRLRISIGTDADMAKFVDAIDAIGA